MTEHWPYYPGDPRRPLLGPQPTKRECCPSCQIIARAVARLAYAIGYEETGDDLADLLAAMGGER